MKPFSRRRFLQKVPLLAAAATGALGAAPADPVPIIDTHIHLYDPTRPGGIPWPPPSDKVLYGPHLPEQFARATKNLNVLGAIVIEANALPADNTWVLELAAEHPMILGYMARLAPGEPGFAARLDSYARQPVFRGLRLRDDLLARNLDQKIFQDDLRRVAEHKLSLDLVGDRRIFEAARRIREIAPAVPLILDHLPFGETDQDFSAFIPALQEAAALPNVFAKISYVLRRPQGKLTLDPAFYRQRLDRLWQLFGEDRVLFGSNWPVSDWLGTYAEVYQVVNDYARARSAAAAAKFFWKNSIAAYHWTPRGAAAALLETK